MTRMKLVCAALTSFVALALLVGGCNRKPTAGGACKEENEAQCTDKSKIVTCKQGKWEEVACRGPKGCEAVGAVVNCDESLAEEGDPCGTDTQESYSCSVDKKTQLKCVQGKWKLDAKCGGPKGCEAKFPFVDCDDSLANAGDPCSKEDHATCATDGRAILECKGGKFAVGETCAKGTCKHDGHFVKCM